MRNEAKLKHFQQASRLGNFTNIAFSLASRHQRLLCYELSTPLLHLPVECGPCNPPQPITSEPFCVQNSLQLLPDISTATEIGHPTWVKLLGVTIRKGAYVIIGSDGLLPLFAKVVDILVLVDIEVLQVTHCVVEYFYSQLFVWTHKLWYHLYLSF